MKRSIPIPVLRPDGVALSLLPEHFNFADNRFRARQAEENRLAGIPESVHVWRSPMALDLWEHFTS